VAALPVVESSTPLIVVEDYGPVDLAALTPLPATPHNTTAFAPAIVPAAPAKASGNAGWGRFQGPGGQSATAYCSAGCRIEGEGSELTWTHRVPCLQSVGQPIVRTPSREPFPSKLKKIRCPYREASTHIALEDCLDINNKFPPQQHTTNRPPISSTMSIPHADRIDDDSEEGSRFSGFERPRSTPGRNTEGNARDGGRIRPSGGNFAGGRDQGYSAPDSDIDNSDSPLFHRRKILGSHKNHWDEGRNVKYDKRLRRLLTLRKRERNSKGSAHKPKRPEHLGVDPFDGEPKDFQRFIQGVEIKLNYFRESLVDDIDKISLVIPLLRAGAKEWYHSMHVYINEDEAICDKRQFDQNNVHQTWESFPSVW